MRERFALNNSDVNGRSMEIELAEEMEEMEEMEEGKKGLGIERLRKNNSNIGQIEGLDYLKKELRKVNGKIPDYDEVGSLMNYYAVINYGTVAPFKDIAFQIDLERFCLTLSESNRKVLDMVINDVSIKIIAEDLELPLQTVYSKVRKIKNLLEDYFKEE